MRNLDRCPPRLRAYSPQILHHPDRHADPLDHIHDPAAEHLIAVHVRRRDEEVGMAPIAGELQTPVGFVLKRDPLPTNRNGVVGRRSGPAWVSV